MNIRKNDTTVEITIQLDSSKAYMRTVILLGFILRENNAFPLDDDTRKAMDDIYLEAIRAYPKVLAPKETQ